MEKNLLDSHDPSIHQKFRTVPKMAVLYYFRLFWGQGIALKHLHSPWKGASALIYGWLRQMGRHDAVFTGNRSGLFRMWSCVGFGKGDTVEGWRGWRVTLTPENPGVRKWNPFWGGSNNAKSIVIWRDFRFPENNSALFGLVLYNDPLWDGS